MMQKQLEQILKGAGDLLLSYFSKPLSYSFKNQQELVTQADIACERYLFEKLALLKPEASFLSEEAGAQGQSSDWCWVIDPLDGTTNFFKRVPYFAISVALTYKGTPEYAAIYQPLLKEFYFAQQGNGAYLNGSSLHISPIADIAQSLLVIGLPYTKNELYQSLTSKIKDIGCASLSLRHFGAAALDCAYVAAGRFDAVFFVDLAWWDCAAGILLIEEAGGIVSDFSGAPYAQESRSFIGANGSIHAELQKLLGAHMGAKT